MFGAGCLWGLRRKMKIILVGCRTLIVVGGSKDLMRADVDWPTLSECEDREMDIVAVAAGERVALDRHMRMVAAHFEVDTVLLEGESLLLWVSKMEFLGSCSLPGGAPLGPGV